MLNDGSLHARRDHGQFHYWGIHLLLEWQNLIGQSMACGWNHHSDENNVEIRTSGRFSLNHLQSAHSSLPLTIHLTQKLSGKGESAGAGGGGVILSKSPKDAWETEHSPWHTGGLIWMDFCFPLIFNHLHRAKWMNCFVHNCDWVKHFAFIGLI